MSFFKLAVKRFSSTSRMIVTHWSLSFAQIGITSMIQVLYQPCDVSNPQSTEHYDCIVYTVCYAAHALYIPIYDICVWVSIIK